MSMREAMRIIDASANRAREALRVMEDVARFVLDDEALCAQLKAFRHDLRAALETLPGGAIMLAAHRDVAGDVGTTISTEAEESRRGVREAAIAAGKRLGESLRSIEECFKVVGADAGAIEALRYRAYDAEKILTLAMGADRAGFVGWRVCAIVTEALCVHHDWLTVARLAIEGGADCVQLREKGMDGAELLSRARALVALGRECGADVVVNDRADVALLAGAAGVHVGAGDLAVEDVRRLAGDELLVGVSASNMDQALAARRAGADYCGVGAMFATRTKKKDSIAGPGLLKDYLETTPPLAPALAIGGITTDNAGELVTAAAGRRFGVAVCGCVCGADDPGRAVADMVEFLIASERPVEVDTNKRG